MKIAAWKIIPLEEFKEIVKNSLSMQEVLIRCGYKSQTGQMNKAVKQHIKDNLISIDHFKKRRSRRKKIDEIFCENSFVSRSVIRSHILSNNFIEYKCNFCGIQPIWNNKKLVLVIDHINGINDDNRIENLRFLCPNCNSQTETFSGKNLGKNKVDNTYITKMEENWRNQEEYFKIKDKEKLNKKKLKTVPIAKDELINILIKEKSMVGASRVLNCSDTALKKKCKKFNINYKDIFSFNYRKKEIVNLYSSGVSASKISKMFETHIHRIIPLLKSENIEIKTIQKISKEKAEEIEKMSKNGFSIREISQRLGVTRKTAKRYSKI